MARLPPPRHAVHRRLWVSDCRAGDDSPLSKPFHQDVPATCHSRRLSTPRRRRCGPNAMFRTRSPPCAAASSPPSSKRCRDAHAAQRQSSDDHDRKLCDAVRLVPAARSSSSARLARAFFSRMILALAVHLKGFGLALRSVSQVSMAASSSATLLNTPSWRSAKDRWGGPWCAAMPGCLVVVDATGQAVAYTVRRDE